jgi:hypothetical protein
MGRVLSRHGLEQGAEVRGAILVALKLSSNRDANIPAKLVPEL